MSIVRVDIDFYTDFYMGISNRAQSFWLTRNSDLSSYSFSLIHLKHT